MRYVQKGNTIYATIMAWPQATKFTFKALGQKATTNPGKIKNVKLLGGAKVPFKQSKDGLTVTLPATHPNEIAPVLAIELKK